MVDLEARKRASAAVSRFFLRGETTNFQYMDDEFPDSTDAAVRAIFSMLWGLYDDLREHNMAGRDELKPDVRGLVERCVVFLSTALEYEWPTSSFSLRRWLKNIVVLMSGSRESVGEQLKDIFADAPGGDVEVWPFFRASDCSEFCNKLPK